jgi:hypothetical protein
MLNKNINNILYKGGCVCVCIGCFGLRRRTEIVANTKYESDVGGRDFVVSALTIGCATYKVILFVRTTI